MANFGFLQLVDSEGSNDDNNVVINDSPCLVVTYRHCTKLERDVITKNEYILRLRLIKYKKWLRRTVNDRSAKHTVECDGIKFSPWSQSDTYRNKKVVYILQWGRIGD